jgi:hypothetical protein
MTQPYERTRSLVLTKEFLQRLLDPKQTPRVPKAVRGHARMLLRHFPTLMDIDLVHNALPCWYGPVPPFSRLRGNPQVDSVIAASTAETTSISLAVADLVRAGELLSHAEFIASMGWTQKNLDKALAANRVFFVEVNCIGYFPAFYLDKRCDRRQLEAICEALDNLPGGEKLQFFRSHRGSLGGKTPLEALEQGQMPAVLAAAQAFADSQC